MPQMTLTKTRYYEEVFFETGARPVEFSLWTGYDRNGRDLLCWIPECIPESLWQAAQEAFPDAVMAQAKNEKPRKVPRVRANKSLGRNREQR